MKKRILQDMRPWAIALAIWAVTTLSFMAAMGIGSGIFLLASLWYLRNDQEILWRSLRDPLFLSVIFYFLTALVSVAAATIWPPLGMPLEPFWVLKKFHYYLLPFLAAAALYRSSGQGLRFERHIFWRAFYWMAMIVSIIGILQFWAAYLFPSAWLSSSFFRVIATGNAVRSYHAQGLMFFHLSFASALGFVSAYAWARYIWPLADDSRRDKIAWRVLLIFSSLAFFFTYSRISWLALAGLVLTLAYLKHPRIGLSALIALSFLAILIWNISPNLRGRWNLGWNTWHEREQVWLAAKEMIKDRPITGVGFGKTGYYSPAYAERALGRKPDFSSHAHNNILDILASTGLLGLFGFLAWWIVLWRKAWKAFQISAEKDRWLPAACLGAFVAFHINGLTQVNFYDAKSEHSLMLWAGIVLALSWRVLKKRANEKHLAK